MPSKYNLDQFYTKPEVAKKCIDTLNLDRYKTIIEPSAGNGSFSNLIEGCYAYDIDPKLDYIEKIDFFELDYTQFEKPILVIGNPPFGRNANLAFNFIEYSSNFADTIAFILPKSFRKISFYNRIPLNFWLDYDIELDDNSFTYYGEDKNIPCVFQVYNRYNIERNKIQKTETNLFNFVSKEKANLSFRRVGVYAGKCYREVSNKSPQSHYFIYADNPERIMNIINNIEWAHENTVGPRSVSKTELIISLERYLGIT